MKQIIEITVSPTGQTNVQTKGFVGGECRDASRFIEEALGRRRDADDRVSSGRSAATSCPAVRVIAAHRAKSLLPRGGR